MIYKILLYKYLTFLTVNCVNNIFKKKLKVFKKIPNNYSYNSRDNDQFLSTNELKKMIAHVGNFKKSDVG